MTKLGLGTAQFGMDYGVSNRRGQCPPREIGEILDHARELGVTVIDTAAAYGSSEEALGQCLGEGHGFEIVTKLPPIEPAPCAESAKRMVWSYFERSLTRLGQQAVHALLVHRAADLIGAKGASVWSAMRELRDEGLVARIGASVYGAADIEALLEHFSPDLIQLPFNILGQDVAQSGWLARLKEQGVEIHARSAFLQGALLMDPATLPPHLANAAAWLESWRRAMAVEGLDPIAGALACVRARPEIDVIVAGVTCASELREIAAAAARPLPSGIDWSRFALEDAAITDPRNWPPAPGQAVQAEHAA